MQVNNNSKVPQGHPRQRPLQNSMFLPEHRSPQNMLNPSQQQPQGEFQMFNPLKRSLVQGSNTNNFSSQYQFRTQVNHSFTSQGYQQPPQIQGQVIPLQNKKLGQSELINHSFSLTNIKAGGLLERNKQGNGQITNKNFSKADRQLSDVEQQQKIFQIVNMIKEKHLPGLVDIVKKELHGEINNIKVQFNKFKEQVKTSLQRLSSSGATRDSTPIKRNKQKDIQINDVAKQLLLLQGRIKKIQSVSAQNFNYFGQQIDRISQHLTQKQNQEKKPSFKISKIKSSLPPVMLEYKEMFIIKKTQNQPSKRAKSEEIMLSACNYFVDRHGYLMDNENFYLVDSKGNQIKLEENHIKLLQMHKIIQR